MEDKSSSDEENKTTLLSSPKTSGKKLKLNDGSSQDSLQDAGSSNNGIKDKNVDSGVSADKSPSTSSDDRAPSTSDGPSNEVVNAAPSSSNVRAILLNIIRPKRNYRKRKTADRDSDSNDGSTDSDDYSDHNILDNSMPESRQTDNSNSDAESDDLLLFPQRFPNVSMSPSGTNSSSDSNASYESDDDMIQMADSSDDDDADGIEMEANQEDEENKGKPPPVLTKIRPKHNYFMLREIINREMGLTFPCGKTTKADVMFEKKFCGSLHAVYRMKKLHNLNKHRGCVNSLNFHPEGHLLVTGSDDLNIIVWDWARNQPLQTVKTGHKSNVLQSKFLHLNARSQLNIVTCARDGQVRLIQCPPSGGAAVSRRRLAAHSRAAHKLHVAASEPHIVVSCGEDGIVMQCDVRAEHASRLFQVKEKGTTIQLYSIDGHPLDSKELLLAGRDKFVRIYDRRKCTKPIAMYCPGFFQDTTNTSRKQIRMSMMHLTCAVYNHYGTEILGSYNDEDIYLFDAKNDLYDKDNTSDLKEGYTHRYSGHRNSATFKGVSFFGPKSEYIVSGSDCSHIYFWEKKTEAIVQWMQGDVNGVVNCLEEHPRFPILATSGLDKDIKIWVPRAHKDPDYEGLERVVRENATEVPSPLFNDFLPSLYNSWQSEGLSDLPPRVRGEIEFDGNVCSLF